MARGGGVAVPSRRDRRCHPDGVRVAGRWNGRARVSAVALPIAAAGGKSLWYLTRSTGLVALLLLTATVVLGAVAPVPLPRRAPEPLAVLCGLRGPARRDDGERRLRTDRVRRRLPPLPDP